MASIGYSDFAPPSIAELLNIDCPLLRVRAVRSAITTLGFDWLDVVALTPGRSARRIAAWDALAPAAAAGHGDPSAPPTLGPNDLRLALALASPLPCAWDVESIDAVVQRRGGCAGNAQDPWIDWLERLRAVGVGSGLTFAARGDLGGAWVVSLLAARTDRQWMGDAVIGRALLVACVVAESCAARVGEPVAELDGDDALSQTQRHILECLSQGLSDKVIADRLGMTTHNVDYHLRRLRQRFGARNRVQLVQSLRRPR